MRRFIVTPTALKQILLTAFILSLSVSGCAITENADTTDPEQVHARNKATLRRYFDEIFNNRDLTNAHEYVSPTFKYSGTEAVDSSDLDLEKKGYIKFFKRIFALMEGKWEEPKVEVKEIVAEGNKAVVSYKATGLFYPGEKGRAEQNAVGVPLIVNGMSLYDLDEDGLILKVHSVEDASPIVKAEMEYAQKQQSDLESRNKAQVRRFYSELIDKKDLTKMPEIISPNMGYNGDSQGDAHKELSDFLEYVAKHFDEIEVLQEHMVAEGNWVVRRSLIQFNYYPGGNAGEENAFSGVIRERKMNFFEFDEDGLIIQNFEINDGPNQVVKINKAYAERKQ